MNTRMQRLPQRQQQQKKVELFFVCSFVRWLYVFIIGVGECFYTHSAQLRLPDAKFLMIRQRRLRPKEAAPKYLQVYEYGIHKNVNFLCHAMDQREQR